MVTLLRQVHDARLEFVESLRLALPTLAGGERVARALHGDAVRRVLHHNGRQGSVPLASSDARDRGVCHRVRGRRRGAASAHARPQGLGDLNLLGTFPRQCALVFALVLGKEGIPRLVLRLGRLELVLGAGKGRNLKLVVRRRLVVVDGGRGRGEVGHGRRARWDGRKGIAQEILGGDGAQTRGARGRHGDGVVHGGHGGRGRVRGGGVGAGGGIGVGAAAKAGEAVEEIHLCSGQ